MSLVKITSTDEYKNFIKSDDLSIIHFYAPWAEQCVQMNEVLEQLIKLDSYKNVKFANIVAEDLPEISLECKIEAVPTTLLFKSKKIVGRVDGANPSEVREKIDSQISSSNKPEPENLEKKLEKLINKAQCMLFMKGNRENPRCGFSRTMVALLNEHKADYETFDILEDNEVREGLKKYSNWPTYPQLYIKGELIGGLDIIKEMSESGELDSMLPKDSGNVEDKLKKLINQAPCMLFMKGSRDVPRCGFSKTITAILNEHKADYQTFDILEDNAVREGLKKYSNWPTYPQLYINGDLIGGLDIVREMNESGELENILPKKET
ncbi:glutaredoxin-3 [Phymastichus coffea]|uniref:glutaredoxin-3 n=1 Tax=Phymastichus coffea TaxID=108790 RepID=UPI00273B5691|nr:glutaredoxin-3 [Phymastichus coffea]